MGFVGCRHPKRIDPAMDLWALRDDFSFKRKVTIPVGLFLICGLLVCFSYTLWRHLQCLPPLFALESVTQVMGSLILWASVGRPYSMRVTKVHLHHLSPFGGTLLCIFFMAFEGSLKVFVLLISGAQHGRANIEGIGGASSLLSKHWLAMQIYKTC